MEGEDHECSQKVTLNTICIKLENIEKSIIKIEKFQENYADQIEAVRMNSAKYPSPEEVKDYIKKIDVHETRINDTGKVLWISITAFIGMVIMVAREYLISR